MRHYFSFPDVQRFMTGIILGLTLSFISAFREKTDEEREALKKNGNVSYMK